MMLDLRPSLQTPVLFWGPIYITTLSHAAPDRH
jgi:hypothetical protein